MFKKTLLSLLAVIGLASTSLYAQAAETITLDEAIKIALDRNVSLLQQRNTVDIRELDVLSAKGNFLPTLNGSMSAGRNTGLSFNNNTGEFGDFTIKSISGSINSGITLFSGFRNIKTLQASQSNLQSAKAVYQRNKETVIFNTASAYLQLLINEQVLKVAKENLETSQKQFEQVSEQVNVGSKPIADQYSQESTVANNELSVLNAENNVALSKTRLINILALDPLKDYNFVIPELNAEDFKPKYYTLNDLFSTALRNRTDLRASRLQLESSKLNIDVAKAGLYPTLSASFSMSSSYNDQTRGLDGSSVSFADQFYERNVRKSLGLSLRVPIFNGFSNHVNIQRAILNYRNAKLALEGDELGVAVEVRQAYNDYMSFVQQQDATKKALLASEKNFETEQERYNVGSSTLIELSQANARYFNAQIDRIQNKYNLVFQSKLLDFYIGKLNEELNF